MESLGRKLDEGDEIVAVFLDLSKAFDTVNHRLLLKKLGMYGLPDSVVRWVGSFLRDR